MQKALAIFKPAVWLVLILSLLTACQQPSQEKSGQNQDTEQSRTTMIENEDEQPQGSGNQTIPRQEQPEETKGKTLPATVVKVIDGDTVKIKMKNGHEETVRLLLIDTPETVHPSKPVQPFGLEASQLSKKMMPPGTAIEVEPGINERDKYGRLLAYFYVNGESVNQKLIEKGLARVAYVYAPNTKYIDQFRELQEQARQKEIGIWSIENYATSQGFDDSIDRPAASSYVNTEELQKDDSCKNPQIKGNVNLRGEKVYHIPSGQYYSITKPEEMFCTETVAEQDGFRKSQR
ncbi:thermonuclease family protein [Peribacillus cavernae]|nr:thermonuclease family protein [Peribacillus cavernae]MDQ0217281.1 micrococcal nuclease [Peribacillus cavernae]